MGEATTPPSAEVVIAGRAFTLGTAYRPRQGASFGRPLKPRRLLAHDPDSLLPGGRVEFTVGHTRQRRVMGGTEWAAWAGEPVEDGPGEIGR